MTDQSQDEARLAFIDVSVFGDGSIRGGVLVTDLETRPYEFRVTTPVKPSSIQRVLYGRTLSEYVYGELITFPLVTAVKEKISLVIAKNEHLLIMRPKVSFPVVVIKKNAEFESNRSVSTYSFDHHPSYAGEGEWAGTLLNNLIEKHDPLEPFERLKVAMEEVHTKKIGGK